MTPSATESADSSRLSVSRRPKRKISERAQLAHIRSLHANLEQRIVDEKRNMRANFKPLAQIEEAILDDLRFLMEITQDRDRAIRILLIAAAAIAANTTTTLTSPQAHSSL